MNEEVKKIEEELMNLTKSFNFLQNQLDELRQQIIKKHGILEYLKSKGEPLIVSPFSKEKTK